MTVKFTKGPWRIGGHPPNGEMTIGTESGLMVAVATTGNATETYHNASLIAASPDMYAMLLQLQIEGGLGIARHRQIDRLLAKARGEV